MERHLYQMQMLHLTLNGSKLTKDRIVTIDGVQAKDDVSITESEMIELLLLRCIRWNQSFSPYIYCTSVGRNVYKLQGVRSNP